MATTPDFDTWKQRIVGFTEDAFKQAGEMKMLCVFEKPDGTVHLIAVPEPMDKDLVAHALKSKLREEGARYCAFLSEAWAADVPAAEQDRLNDFAKGQSLEHFPGRKEIVILVLESDQGHSLMGSFEITEVEGQRTLGPFKEMGSGLSAGRFVGLLADPKQH